jgi:DNA polymerase-3 subunit alpha
MTGFIHLRVHTEYSLVDSLVRVDALVDAVAEQRMPACAITDQGNVSALVKFYKPALARGVKPIIGADLWVAESPTDREPARLTLLCQNPHGFKGLSALLTQSAVQGVVGGRNVVLKVWLTAAALEGLIGLSGGQQGELGRALVAGRGARSSQVLDHWTELFPGRFYVELQRLGRAAEQTYVSRAVELAAAAKVPVVATNEVCFLARDDFEAHETRVCIAQGESATAEASRDWAACQYACTT